MRPYYLWVIVMLPSLIWSALGPISPAHAQGEQILSGKVVNGTSSGAGRAGLEVALLVIDGLTMTERLTTQTEEDGHFQFAGVPVGDTISYLVSVTYEGVSYTRELDSTQPASSIEVTVYDTTSSIQSLQLEAYVLLIRGADQDSSNIFALELASLLNDGERTFVPDLAQGGMNFLRFSLPPNFDNLEVQSSLSGGQLLTTDRGFAITVPVPPGSHEVAFTYQTPYKNGKLQFIRSLPLETGIFRLLLPDGVGRVVNGDLQEMEIASLPGGVYRVWEASQMAAGSQLSVSIERLPQPPLHKRIAQNLTEGRYFKIGVPATLGAFLALVLMYSFLRSQPVTLLAPDDRSLKGDSQGSARQTLVEAIARLDDLFESGGIDEEDYTNRRMILKQRFLQQANLRDRTTRPRAVQDE